MVEEGTYDGHKGLLFWKATRNKEVNMEEERMGGLCNERMVIEGNRRRG